MSVYFVLELIIFVMMWNTNDTNAFVIFAYYFVLEMFVMIGNTSDV